MKISPAGDSRLEVVMNLGTLYLLVAAALLFGAGIFAAKHAFPQLQLRQVSVIALIACVTVGLIWAILDVADRKREATPVAPATQPSPLQQGQYQP